MLYKYLKLIIFSTLLLQAAPEVYSSLGDELETFQEDCRIYKKMSSLPEKIKKSCTSFNSKTIKVFKVGYELDDSENINELKLNKYLKLLRELDESKNNILRLIYSEAKKARNENNIKYYSQLISNNKVKLEDLDYEFMKKHKSIFAKNVHYKNHESHIRLENERKKEAKRKYEETVRKIRKIGTDAMKEKEARIIKQSHINTMILNSCKTKWGTDYINVEYCFTAQQEAFNYLKKVSNSIIKQQCQQKWGTDYNMLKHCIEQQQAKSRLEI